MSYRGKVLAIVLAIGVALSLVAAAVWLGTSRMSGASRRAAAGPKVVFAEGARTGDAALDTFVHDFVELCLKGDYDGFRLCWTAYSPPPSGSRFRAMWDAAEEITITRIAPVPGKNGQVYLVRASAKLNPKVKIQQQEVEILVLREEGKWVIAPAPRPEPVEEELPAFSVGDTQPASQD